MLRNLQGWPLVIIILAIIILVGWKRLPDAARSVGRSMRIFKSEVEQMSNKSDEDKPSAASTDTVDGTHHREPIHRDEHTPDEVRREETRRQELHDDDIRRDGVEHSSTDERNS
ncbi:MAG: Sec-independent protein translocase subunit TatA [Ornithinimicrobium sp.]